MLNSYTLVLAAKIQDCETGLEAIVSVSLNTSQNSCDRPTLYFQVIPDIYLLLVIQYCLDLRKNLDLRKIVATTDFLVHKLFDLRKIF